MVDASDSAHHFFVSSYMWPHFRLHIAHNRIIHTVYIDRLLCNLSYFHFVSWKSVFLHMKWPFRFFSDIWALICTFWIIWHFCGAGKWPATRKIYKSLWACFLSPESQMSCSPYRTEGDLFLATLLIFTSSDRQEERQARKPPLFPLCFCL